MKPKHATFFALPVLALLAAVSLAATAAAEPPEVAAGRRLAERNCGECHATGAGGESRLDDAPPFRTLYRRFDVASLPLALQDGMLVGHPRMPLIELDRDEVDALTAYLKSFVPKKPASPTHKCARPCS